MTTSHSSKEDGPEEGSTSSLSGQSITLESFILVLALQVALDADFQLPCLNAISSRVIMTVASDEDEALDLLSSPHLIGVFVADAYIAQPEHSSLLIKLVEYVKAGGTVVLGGSFSCFFPQRRFQPFFNTAWGLPWVCGSYFGTTATLNSSNVLVKTNPQLLESDSVKALRIRGMLPIDAIYLPTTQSELESLVFPPTPVENFWESPAVITSVGNGRLGYIGDINWQGGSTLVILAMFNILNLEKAR